MAAALIAGLANELTQAADIHVVDPNADALARLRTQYGVTTAGRHRLALAVRHVGQAQFRQAIVQLIECLVEKRQQVGRGAEFRRQGFDAFTRVGDLVRGPARQGVAMQLAVKAYIW